MSDLAGLLQASLSPATRKQAEQSLDSYSTQQGFLPHLLHLVLDRSVDPAARLAGSIYLKNVAKLKWDEDVQPLPEADKELLRSQLVPAMLALSNRSDRPIRAQVAESVSLIAELDFPARWGNLIDQIVASLSPTDYDINIGVLETAHSIFRPWRAQVRSDALFTEINLVFRTFMTPFLQLFRQTASVLLSSDASSSSLASAPQDLVSLAHAQRILVDIYYDFTCQDLPPDLEDTHEEFFAPQTGWFQRFMTFDPESLRVDPEQTIPSLSSQIKTGILEIAEIFVKLYPDQLARTSSVEGFVQGVWNSLGSGRLAGVADDQLVSQSLRFISVAIRSGNYLQLFGSKEIISSLIQGVVIPNVGLREHEVERFEDDPLEYVRQDLILPSISGGSTDNSTRRQAAADVLQALVGSGYEAETTEIVGTWITTGLQEYNANPTNNWKAKDTAVYLLTAVATRGWTTQRGVTSTNTLVHVASFFSEHVLQDLQAPPGAIHPILQVDAIRFLHTFRNQLTKEQLLEVMNPLVAHLRSGSYVAYTYAAITIERILIIKQDSGLLFTPADIHSIAPELLNTVLTKVESAGSPEKVAENEHLMKCANRVIIVARQSLTPAFEQILNRLVGILSVICKCPSNPYFDQYIFESMSALLRFIVSGAPETLQTFEEKLFGPFTLILQEDVDQYVPYVFQILAQMLHLHAGDVPAAYRSLLPFLLTPAIWQQKGSIPGLVRLLREFLAKDGQQIVSTGQLTAVLAVVQQRLIPSKLNDAWGLELLQGVVENISATVLKQYFRAIVVTLLTRLQTSKTDKFVRMFVYFLMFTMALQREGLGPDYVIGAVEEIQPQLWWQLLTNFILPQIPTTPPKDRKVVVVALTRILTQSVYMMQEPNAQAWPAILSTLVPLFHDPQFVQDKASEDPDAGMTEIDYEEQTAGYQAAYSRLAASESAAVDPVAYVGDVQAYLGQELVRASRADGRIKELLQAGSPEVVSQFVQSLAMAGYVL